MNKRIHPLSREIHMSAGPAPLPLPAGRRSCPPAPPAPRPNRRRLPPVGHPRGSSKLRPQLQARRPPRLQATPSSPAAAGPYSPLVLAQTGAASGGAAASAGRRPGRGLPVGPARPSPRPPRRARHPGRARAPGALCLQARGLPARPPDPARPGRRLLRRALPRRCRHRPRRQAQGVVGEGRVGDRRRPAGPGGDAKRSATMATSAASAPGTEPSPTPPFSGGSVSSSFQDSESSEVSAWDSQELCRHAECLELEELTAMSVDPSLLPTLNDLLLKVYTMLRPKPVDYEQRSSLVDVFNKMANEIFGNNNGFPAVQAFGSFTMDLFTPRSDLDVSVNFSADTEDQCARKKKISVIRKFAKVLYSHQRDGICCGVLPVVSARVPILNVIDRGTGIECDISVENKDGMTRSMVFKFISSLDERFQILSHLVKFWAKIHDVNSPRERTMSSMSIISLVAFHLQTRHPPILPAFSALLKDGSDSASVERNILLFEGFGNRNKESVAELFVSLMSKLLSVESLWEHGLCASNFEASWISKIWKKGVGNLSVEDFLDRSQNFARSVGKAEMQKICRCLRDCAFNLSDFMRGKIDTSKLKTFLFGRLNPDELVSKPRLKRAKRKRKSKFSPESTYGFQKRAKHAVHHVEPHHRANAAAATGLPTPALVMPPILHGRPTQSTTQFVHKPWPLIIPSGFGYGLSVRLPVTPHLSRGILGRPPGDLIQLNNGIQLPQQGPLLPMPYQPTFGNMLRPCSGAYNGAQQPQHNKNRMVQRIPPDSRR